MIIDDLETRRERLRDAMIASRAWCGDFQATVDQLGEPAIDALLAVYGKARNYVSS